MNSTYSRIPIEFSESIEIPIDINWISNSKYNLNPTYQRMQANFVDGYYTPIDIERIESNFIYNGNFSIYPPSTWYSGSMPGSSASMLIFKWNPEENEYPYNVWYLDITGSTVRFPNPHPWASLNLTSSSSVTSTTRKTIYLSGSSSGAGIESDREYMVSIGFTALNGKVQYPDSDIAAYDEEFYEIELPDGSTEFVEFPTTPAYSSEVANNIYPIEPEYGVMVGWYVGGSTNKYVIKTIISEKGMTSLDIYNEDIPRKPAHRVFKKTFVPTSLFGASAASGSPVIIYVYALEGMYRKTGTVLSPPQVYADGVSFGVTKPYWFGLDASGSPSFEMGSLPRILFSVSPTVLSSACALTLYPMTEGFSDVDGKTGTISSASNLYLTFGKETASSEWMSWIPYRIDCSDSTFNYGNHITSACLICTATSDRTFVPGKIFSITSGFQNQVNPSQPTTWDDLKGRTITSPKVTSIVESWLTGEQYEIDVTDQAKAIFGTDAIWWWTSSGSWNHASVMLKDNGSAEDCFRTITSSENDLMEKPKLVINYARNLYNRKTLGTFMRENARGTRYYKENVGYISGSANTFGRARSLLWFNLCQVPGTITSGSIKIYVQNTSYSETIDAHKMETPWDWYSSSWGSKCGTRGWAGAEGYYSSGPVGTASLTSSETYRWVEIPIDVSTLNSMKTANNGFLLKFNNDTASDKCIHYASQNHSNIAARPKLVLWADGIQYIIQETGLPEGGELPPSQLQPVQLEQSIFFEDGITGNSPSETISLVGSVNTNRYMIISDCYRGDQSGRSSSYITGITINGVSASMLVTASTTSDEANATIWGAKIPQDATSVVISFTRTGNYNDTAVKSKIHIREFSHVNQTTPISSSAGNRNGAVNSYNNSLSIYCPAKGYVADAIFLDNPSTAIGMPSPRANQTLENRMYQYGYSHYTVIPTNVSGTLNIGWDWNPGNRVWVPGDGGQGTWILEGSDSALVAVSLNPEA